MPWEEFELGAVTILQVQNNGDSWHMSQVRWTSCRQPWLGRDAYFGYKYDADGREGSDRGRGKNDLVYL